MKFLARQPILTENGDVYAYELLFRADAQNSFKISDGELATSSLIDTSLLMGLEKLTEGHRAFINCPRDFLLGDAVSLLPPERVVVEILEDVNPDDELFAACRKLKQQGYVLALDDFVDAPAWEPFIGLADYIKVDFRLTEREQQLRLANRYRARGIRLLAEKVETRAEYEDAKSMGYTLFQGYYFCRPEVMKQKPLPSSKVAYLELLQATLKETFDMDALALKVKREPSLTFRLLRYLNSAVFGLRTDVRSVPHALTLLGEQELRRWVALVCVAVLGEGKSEELITLPLIRGRVCELLSPALGKSTSANDLFLLGLLSLMDAILDQPLETVLAELPIRSQIKEALLSQPGIYRDVLDLAIAQERGEWEQVHLLATKLKIDEKFVANCYLSAVEWASELRHGVQAAPTG